MNRLNRQRYEKISIMHTAQHARRHDAKNLSRHCLKLIPVKVTPKQNL